jgi:hypothetical protein
MYFYSYVYVFLLYVYVWLPRLRFFRACSSVFCQKQGYFPQRRGTTFTLPTFCVLLCIFFCIVLWIVCVYMCTVQLPPGNYPIAVNKYNMLSLHVSGQTFILCTSYISLSLHLVFLLFEFSIPILHDFHVTIILLLVFHFKCSFSVENRKYLFWCMTEEKAKTPANHKFFWAQSSLQFTVPLSR